MAPYFRFNIPCATAPPTTTTTTTPPPTLADIGTVCSSGTGCSTGTVSRIYLNASDYSAFVANGNSFNGLGGGGSTTCNATALDINGNAITRYHYDSGGTCWNIVGGGFTYNTFQC